MTSLDSMARRVDALSRSTSTARREEAWLAICAGAQDDLLAFIEEQSSKALPGDDDEDDEEEFDEAAFMACLAEMAETTKQQFLLQS